MYTSRDCFSPRFTILALSNSLKTGQLLFVTNESGKVSRANALNKIPASLRARGHYPIFRMCAFGGMLSQDTYRPYRPNPTTYSYMYLVYLISAGLRRPSPPPSLIRTGLLSMILAYSFGKNYFENRKTILAGFRYIYKFILRSLPTKIKYIEVPSPLPKLWQALCTSLLRKKFKEFLEESW